MLRTALIVAAVLSSTVSVASADSALALTRPAAAQAQIDLGLIGGQSLIVMRRGNPINPNQA